MGGSTLVYLGDDDSGIGGGFIGFFEDESQRFFELKFENVVACCTFSCG